MTQFCISSVIEHVHLAYRQVSNISRTWVGNEIVDHADVVGASTVGAVPTTSSFSTEYLASNIVWSQLQAESRSI